MECTSAGSQLPALDPVPDLKCPGRRIDPKPRLSRLGPPSAERQASALRLTPRRNGPGTSPSNYRGRAWSVWRVLDLGHSFASGGIASARSTVDQQGSTPELGVDRLRSYRDDLGCRGYG